MGWWALVGESDGYYDPFAGGPGGRLTVSHRREVGEGVGVLQRRRNHDKHYVGLLN